METWRFRIMVATALVILLFGDFFGLGAGQERKLQVAPQSPTLRDDQPSIFLDDDAEETSGDILNYGHDDSSAGPGQAKVIKLTDKLRDACLPKMLCEMAAKSPQLLIDKEAHLLELIRSTTLSQSGQNTKWHFAAHMGQLMRYSDDTSGCSNLWPQCPFTSKRLNQLTVKLVLK